MIKKQRGITLISLIITIIILLLLATITISSLTGSGLFEKAQQAEQKSEDAQILENTTLNEYENWLGNYITGTVGGGSTGGGETPVLTITDTTDTKPSQAMPAETTVLENDTSKGIVIADKNGNEWTWVEVPKSIVFKTAQNATDYTNIKTDLINYAATYREGYAGQGRYWIDEYYEGCGVSNSTTYTQIYNKMLSSVYTNGGFWISSYEIGDATATAGNSTRTDSSETSGIAVSKPDQIPYNYVTCSQAQTLASGISTDENKTSSLLFGIQWDLVCKYLEVNGNWETTETITATSYLNLDSTSWGNYKNSRLTLNRGRYNINAGSSISVWTSYTTDTTNYVTNKQTSDNISYYQLLTTGASEDTNKMNIYDFAGNQWEWTLEHAISSTDYPCAGRGGNFLNEGSSYPVSYRSHNTVDYKNSNLGFHVVLY